MIPGQQDLEEARRTYTEEAFRGELRSGYQSELEKAEGRRNILVARLMDSKPGATAILMRTTVSSDVVRRNILPPRTSMIAHFFTETQSLAWVIDDQSTRAVRLPASPMELQTKAKYFRKLIVDRETPNSEISWKAQAGELHRALIAPISPLLRYNQAIIVPHRFLHSFPFAALWNSDHNLWLAEEILFSTAPSATSLTYLKDRRPSATEQVLVLGNPDGTLPAAETEAKEVAIFFGRSAFLRDQASLERFNAEAEKVDVLHLAVHGHTDHSDPLNTWLQLAPGEGIQGRLQVGEISRMNLSEVDLAVLSACDSAIGPITLGDDAVSPARAFLAAGVPTVIASLWPVEDEPSSLVMVSFYSNLQINPTMSVAEALQQAQLGALRKGMPLYFWAGFAPIGDAWISRPW